MMYATGNRKSAFIRLFSGVSALGLAALAPIQASAQTAEAQSTQPSDDDAGLGFDEIIVTGTATGKRKFDASYAVTTTSDKDLQRIAPLSTADLLGQMPGIYAESTGGEASNVYRVRGIPNEGSFQAFQEDGIPLYPESSGFFFTGDGLQRTDIMTQRYEVVRGGAGAGLCDQCRRSVQSDHPSGR